MSRPAQVLLALAIVALSAATTIGFSSSTPVLGNIWPLWVIGGVALVLSLTVDTRLARRAVDEYVPGLRSFRNELSRLVARGQGLRGEVYALGDPFGSMTIPPDLGRRLAKWDTDVDAAVRKHAVDRLVLFTEDRYEVTDWSAPLPGREVRSFVDQRLRRMKLILGNDWPRQ